MQLLESTQQARPVMHDYHARMCVLQQRHGDEAGAAAEPEGQGAAPGAAAAAGPERGVAPPGHRRPQRPPQPPQVPAVGDDQARGGSSSNPTLHDMLVIDIQKAGPQLILVHRLL